MTQEEIAHLLEEASIEVKEHYESRVVYPIGPTDDPQMIERFTYTYCIGHDVKLDFNDDESCEIRVDNQNMLFDGRLAWPASGEEYTTLNRNLSSYRLTLNEAIHWLRRMRA